MKTTTHILLVFVCSLLAGSAFSQTMTEEELMTYINMNQSSLMLGDQGTVVIQQGDDNITKIDGNKASVTQTGQAHQFYYQESTLTPSNLQVNMTGANNYVEVIGNNSIMDNMTINVEGNDRSVIIRNFQ